MFTNVRGDQGDFFERPALAAQVSELLKVALLPMLAGIREIWSAQTEIIDHLKEPRGHGHYGNL